MSTPPLGRTKQRSNWRRTAARSPVLLVDAQSMTMPRVELNCDTCADAAALYRLHGTSDALCAACFGVAYPPESSVERQQRRARTVGPPAAGCLRRLRTAPGTSGVHRILGAPRR